MTTAPPIEPIASRPFVLGTAGHVDHGKSTLVKALTGIDPDRLAEEKARAMTIDLGFAWLTLPSGREVSIVDVPGHERFIKNMLAGVGGIDAALLIVAADEGPMPQTGEHLAILDLLQVRHGLVVLTKTDTVDADWLDLVREEVREKLAATALRDAPILPVSAVTGAGLDELRGAIDRVLDAVPPPLAAGRPRLPIDRVFTVAGFGTVVTGTLLGGELATGQALRLLPAGRPVRVRGLQSHKTKVTRVQPGSRVAANLGGVAVEEIRRGDVLAPAGLLAPSLRLDVRLALLPEAEIELTQNDALDLFIGAAELPARVTLLDRERLTPGEAGLVQLRLGGPVAVLKGDRFIVRRPSPSQTIGGGDVLDPAPPRHKRFRAEVIASLETLEQGSPAEVVLQAVAGEPRDMRSLLDEQPGGLPATAVREAVRALVADGDVIVLGADAPPDPKPANYLLATTAWDRLLARGQTTLAAFHTQQPLRRGLPREEFRQRLGVSSAKVFDDLLATAGREGRFVDAGPVVRLATFRITLPPDRRALADRYLAALRAHPYQPPPPVEFGIDADTLGALVDLGQVVRVGEGVVYAPEVFAAIKEDVLSLIARDGSLTLAGFRDHFGTSRKYAQPTLEYLDQARVTRRVGDTRIRGTAIAKQADVPP